MWSFQSVTDYNIWVPVYVFIICLIEGLKLRLVFGRYSALKVNGVRMSDLVARGEDVQPKQARLVTVHSLKCLEFAPPYFTLGKTLDRKHPVYFIKQCKGQ